MERKLTLSLLRLPPVRRAPSKNFSFRCHREKVSDRDNADNVYSVNRIAIHPSGIFTTAGSDGMYNFWDKESKQRVWKPLHKTNAPITVTAFNRTGTMMAYSVGYDWSKVRPARDARGARWKRAVLNPSPRAAVCRVGRQGVEGYNPAFKTAILIKVVTDEQIKVKPKK